MADKVVETNLSQTADNGSTATAIIVDGIPFMLEGEPPICTHYFRFLGQGV
jgi:hypothetical protein